MTDRELLELAAKAAGIEGKYQHSNPFIGDGGIRLPKCMSHEPDAYWNPLTDDGDALRLAVKLGIVVDTLDNNDQRTIAWTPKDRGDVQCYEQHSKDPYAATRRAIVRAAAEIGVNYEP